ncbi:MAG: hypothetical protein HUU35_16940, partial [Armatimonadetes bacterium]|nr:hypothetical protein [Armatimonadota bacterium]
MRSLLARRRRGQGLAEVAVVCSIMTSMAGGGAGAAWQVLGTAQRTVAMNQMKQIHLALTMFADDNDALPTADMYPDIRKDPQAAINSPRSIRKILGNGLPAALWVAPRAPEVFQKAGLTYIWNSSANGKQLDQLGADTWLLADMNAAAFAVPDLVPQPQGIGYLILYADGHVKYEMRPPAALANLPKEALTTAAAAPAGAGAGG